MGINPREIIRVWGRADRFDIEFSRIDINRDDQWEVSIPPDLSDGQYAVEIHAINRAGYTDFWTGILYMANGNLIYFRLYDSNYIVTMSPDIYEIHELSIRYTIVSLPDRYKVRSLDSRYIITSLEVGA